MKPFAERFYKSRQWQHTRDAYAQSVGGLCEDCLKDGIITPGEIVHHIRPINEKTINDPNVAYSWDNLRLLCRKHHERIHRRKQKRYTFDKEGHVIILSDEE